MWRNSVHLRRHSAQSIQPKFQKFQSKTEWISLVQRKCFGPPFELDHFSRLDRSDGNGPLNLTIPSHGGKHLSLQLLWIVNIGSVGVTRTSMCSYNRSVAALQAKCMVWLLMALKHDLIWYVLFII